MEDILKILNEISRMIQPLRPPVLAFESSIRRTPFRILISVLLSARTKDPVTKQASENLFSAAPTAAEMTALTEERIAELIFPVGFYKQKAAHIKKIAEKASQTGEIPGSYEGLTALPGVGRKTANLVLALAFDIPAIAVDTHVFRISKRLGWASGKTPEDVEEELKALFPETHWKKINQTLVGFGQTICAPRKPHCSRCSISGDCPFFKTSGG
ncbi:endonuclease III domain-containing protein [Acidobacteriota bacterium]